MQQQKNVSTFVRNLVKMETLILVHKHETTDKNHLKYERNKTLTHYGMQMYQNQEANFHLEQAPSAKFTKTTKE